MADNNSHDTEDESNGSTSDSRAAKADGGVASGSPAQAHRNTDYLSSEVNLLNPSTQFMRDHLRLVWGTFIAWVIIVWGPVTLTRIAPDLMTTTTIPGISFPLHYFLVALGAPTGSLVLAAIYARRRDRLDQKYGIDHSTVTDDSSTTDVAATDGGEQE